MNASASAGSVRSASITIALADQHGRGRRAAKTQISSLVADVLSNRNPSYRIRGGVYDVLTQTGGEMLVADNSHALEAMTIFRELDGVDIDPAAGVAFSSLVHAVERGDIKRTATILLHVTGGRSAQAEWLDTPPVQPTLTSGIEGPPFEPLTDRIINSMQGKAFA